MNLFRTLLLLGIRICQIALVASLLAMCFWLRSGANGTNAFGLSALAAFQSIVAFCILQPLLEYVDRHQSDRDG